MKNQKTKVRIVDPKSLPKHSKIMHRSQANNLVSGERTKTKTGYTASRSESTGFETYFETILSGGAWDVLMHDRKVRVVHVISGTGFVRMGEDFKKVLPGDSLAFNPGVEYSIGTYNQDVSFYVVQEAKYDARLIIVADGASLDIPPDVLTGISPEDKVHLYSGSNTRRGSKAREQAALSSSNKRRDQIVTPSMLERVPDTVDGVNLKPSMGRFSNEGAG